MASPAVVRLPDVEDLLTTYVTIPQGDDPALKIVGRVPDPRPDEFFRVERTGGVRQSPISDLPTVVLEAWALDDDRAADLLNVARKVFQELAGTRLGACAVKSVTETGGMQRLPDPLSTQSRYTTTFSIHLKGAAS